MVNKRVAEMFIVCLSCHFGVGESSHTMGQEIPQLTLLMMLYDYNNKNLFWNLKLK
jgi:hypothetical protein